MRSFVLGILASAAAFGLSPAPAHAGTFSISPLRLELSQSARTAALTVRNHEPHEVLVQAEGLHWDQVDGRDELRPTPELLVSPAVFTLPPNGTQIVRVAVQRAPDATTELNYRLLLSEVPKPAAADFTGLNVALRLSLPVFLAPQAPARAELQWSASRRDDGQIAVTAHNAGLARARILGLNIGPATDAAVLLDERRVAYILPGRSRTWIFDNQQGEMLSGGGLSRLRVTGATEAGDFYAESDISGD